MVLPSTSLGPVQPLGERSTIMLAAVGVYGIWGFSFLASKYAQMAATPFVVLMYRFDIACLVLTLPWLLGRQTVHLKGKNVRGLLLLGLCEPVIYFIGEQYGVRYTSSAFSGVMIAVIPIVTLMMAAVFLRERPAPLQWVFSAVSIGGVIAITLMAGGGGEITAAGVGFLVLAVLSGSAYAVVSRAISDDFSAYERSLVMQLMEITAAGYEYLDEQTVQTTEELTGLATADIVAMGNWPAGTENRPVSFQ